MKKLLLILICIPIIRFGQTKSHSSYLEHEEMINKKNKNSIILIVFNFLKNNI